jgi:hypothetical protein
MHELPEGRLVFAVAQTPFESQSTETQNVNVFATLVPLLDDTGNIARNEDFPESGLVWWMLRSGARTFAEPGRLVSGYLEYAKRYRPGDPESHFFQVDFQSVEPVRPDAAVEVLSVNTNRVRQARDLVNLEDIAEVDHPPTGLVMARWRDSIYGPLKATSKRREDDAYTVSLAVPGVDREVLRIPARALEQLSGFTGLIAVDLSLDNQPVYSSSRVRLCQYEIITGPGLTALRGGGFETLLLLPDDEVIRRAAKPLLARKDRQHLTQLLDRLSGQIAESGESPGVLDMIERTQRRLIAGDALAAELADALITSGLLDGTIEQKVLQRAEAHIESNAASLRAQIAERTRGDQERLEQLRRERERLDQEVDQRRRDGMNALDTELRAAREAHERRIREEADEIATQKEDLERQRTIVSTQLDAVRERFETARTAVLQDYVAMLPLLERMMPQISHGSVPPTLQAPAGDNQSARKPEPLAFPAFVVHGRSSGTAAVVEEDFFDRFKAHVRRAGFQYREIDLLTFHLSVKTGDLTILGGVSGTGKSSLPRLYAEALAGEEAQQIDDEPEARYLHIGVRPSWLDQQDLLGHVNSLEGSFVPSESGLYRFSIYAQREFDDHRLNSGLYLACLDEMNLSHVEHYFSGFLQALERTEGLRTVRCFDPRAVRTEDPFHAWHTLTIPRTLRFVGTVNYDETTKPLSLRLLDRANVIHVQSTSLRELSWADAGEAGRKSTGKPVRWDDYRAWVRDEDLDRQFAELLDRLRAPLGRLRSPLTPRRYRSICRFVASAAALCSASTAFDLQITQRIVPQLRGLFTPGAREAFGQLLQIVNQEAESLPETRLALESVAERELGEFDG